MDLLRELPKLAERESEGHKGDYGHGLLIGGSRGMAGAISLAAQAALRSGIGLATVAVPERCVETVAGYCPVYMVAPLPDQDPGRISRESFSALMKWSDKATVFALGPGLGQSDDLRELTQSLFTQLPRPLVLDADGLNNLSVHRTWYELPSPAPRILTPHPGEMQRLSGVSSADRSGQCQAAAELAKCFGGVIVLKGNRTLVTDGKSFYENRSGNPAMASGGSGDVLTGVITALIGQRLDPFQAAVLGVFLHGLAGDLARKSLGGPAVLATDLIAFLPEAFKVHRAS
jgi:NAD(P)H-hydrate epimerase